jgi:nucleotide-binding universal stress UspA family protein
LPDLGVVMPTSYSDDEALFRAIVAAGHLLKQILGQDPVTAVRTVAAGGSLLDPAATAAVLARMQRPTGALRGVPVCQGTRDAGTFLPDPVSCAPVTLRGRSRRGPSNRTELPMTATQTTEHQERIVVGVDGSPASLGALEWAVRQAALTGAVVEAVTAWHFPAAYGGYPIVAQTDWQATAREIQESAVKEALGHEATALVRRVAQGHPVQVLLDAAADADLLVVGSRGHGGFTGMLLGSVSEHVVAHAPCAVVVVKSPATAGDARDLSVSSS